MTPDEFHNAQMEHVAPLLNQIASLPTAGANFRDFMTARERIQKSIRDIDIEIEVMRGDIHRHVKSNLWNNPGQIHERAKLIATANNTIFSLLQQRRGFRESVKLLDYHASKNPQAAKEVGL